MAYLRNRKKEYKKRIIISLLILLLTFSCFISVTYAWFTHSVYVKGNKVFAGNLMVDVLINEFDLRENLGDSFNDLSSSLEPFKYVRELDDGTTETYYYASRIPSKIDEDPIDTSILHVDNVEPGQAIRVKVNIVNSGDLALKAAGALRVNESLTGLETLMKNNKQDNEKFDENGIPKSFNSEHPDSSNISGLASIDDETLYFNTLLNMQAEVADSSDTNVITVNDISFKDIGGHLEDALYVYLLEDVGDGDIEIDDKILSTGISKLTTDDYRFFGSLRQFEYMLTYGANPTDENKIKYMELWDINPYENKGTSKPVGDLEYDYQRYLEYASGYCLPLNEIVDDNNRIDTDFDAYINDLDENLLYVKEDVSEMDTINFLLFMPIEEVGNEYQNASLSLSLGATATQVEYEKDGTNYMIYDKSSVDPRNLSHEFTTITYKVNNEVRSMQIPLLTKGTTVNFEAGVHANYDPLPKSIDLEEDTRSLDLTADSYVPNVDENCMFVGFTYDNKTNTLIAKSNSKLEKGGLISIDNKEYRVLEVDETGALEAKLLAMYDAVSKEGMHFVDLEYDSYANETRWYKYQYSNIDVYLENRYYSSLPFKDAIIPQYIEQNVYGHSVEMPDSDTYYTAWYKGNFNSTDTVLNGGDYYYIEYGHEPMDIGLRHCYLLDIKDIVDYLGENNITPQNINKMFFNTDSAYWKSSINENIWLRTAELGNYYFMWFINGYEGSVHYQNIDSYVGIHPSFAVDLSKVDYEKLPSVIKGDLITIEDKVYRVIDVNGKEVELLSMNDVEFSMAFNDDSITTYFGEIEGEQYENSTVDNYLNGEFYESLSFKDAIIPQDIDQNMYSWKNNSEPSSGNFYTSWYKLNFVSSDTSESEDAYPYYIVDDYDSINVGSRNCYLLDVKDVLKYLDNNITPQRLNIMFFNVDNGTSASNTYLWLRSASAGANDEKNMAWIVNNKSGYMNINSCIDGTNYVRPAFVVDITKIDYTTVE